MWQAWNKQIKLEDSPAQGFPLKVYLPNSRHNSLLRSSRLFRSRLEMLKYLNYFEIKFSKYSVVLVDGGWTVTVKKIYLDKTLFLRNF